MSEKDEHVDADIFKSKEDAPEEMKEASVLMSAVVKANKNGSAGREQSEIPKFDLADNIMAEYRKATATKRTGPVKNTQFQKQEPEAERVNSIGPPKMTEQEQDQIITEIVAKDIEKLCRGELLSI